MRLLISGASGFIGAAVVRRALDAGHAVGVLMREGSDDRRLRAMDGWTRFDVGPGLAAGSLPMLRDFEPRCFVHCAWRGVAGAERNAAWQITENLPMTLTSVELAAAAGCRMWIGLGSQAEYGPLNCRVSESMAERPATLYGRAKLSAGIAACGLAEALGMSAAWLRVFSVYGPGDAPHWFLPYVVNELAAGRSPRLTACTQRWDYLHVDDAAAAILATAETEAAGTFNLGSGDARMLRDWVELIRTALGSSPEVHYGAVPFRQDQVMHLEADIARLRSATGWEPVISPEQGIISIMGAATRP